MSLLDTLMDLEKLDDPKILRAPFRYAGAKSRSIKNILPLLPYRSVYVEPFGGSAAILLARHSSHLEVFNDRYAGVVAFYRVLRDAEKMRKLCARLELTVHAREEWAWAKETWENTSDDVERAALWYYMTCYSFAGLGRHFGRAKRVSPIAGKIQRALKHFSHLHDRLTNVQIENLDWSRCLSDYDQDDAVFYLDPPYLDTSTGTFKHTMNQDDHRRLLDQVFNMQGFVAISGYGNTLYDSYGWDSRHEWESFVSMKPAGDVVGNRKEQLTKVTSRQHATEVLWIKESK